MSIDFTGGNPASPEGQDQDPAGGNEHDTANSVTIEYNGKTLTQEEVLKKLAHADSHIETLTAEREADRGRLSQLEEAVSKATKVEDVLKALQGEGAAPAEPEPTNSNDAPDIEATLDELLAKREAARTADENWSNVTKTLAEAFGSKTNEKVAEVAAENDMTLEEAEAFARSKPKAFLKLFGKIGSTTTTPISQGGRNPNAHRDQPASPTGYMEARTTKDQVDIYRRKLAQFGL